MCDNEPAAASVVITAPMRGSVVSIDVVRGVEVISSQQVAMLEAMKIHHVIEAQTSGTVTDIVVVVDDVVDENDALVILVCADHTVEEIALASEVDLDAPHADLDEVRARHVRGRTSRALKQSPSGVKSPAGPRGKMLRTCAIPAALSNTALWRPPCSAVVDHSMTSWAKPRRTA